MARVARCPAGLVVSRVVSGYLGAAYYRVGDCRQALDVSRQPLVLLTGEWPFARFGQAALVAVAARGILAWNLTELGGFAEGYRVGEEAIQLAEALRAGHQPQDRQGSGPDIPSVGAGAGGSGDSVARAGCYQAWALVRVRLDSPPAILHRGASSPSP